MDDAPRNLRLRPEVICELRDLRTRLLGWVKLRLLTSDAAMREYNARVAVVVRDPASMMVDDRTWSPVRCRRCNREGSVPAGADKYACRCTPSVERFLARDLIAPDGTYAVDPFALPVSA